MAKKKLEVEKVIKEKYLGKKYRIFYDTKPEGLEEQVDTMIAKSWRIAGGMSVNSKGFYQAMCKG